VEANRAIRNPSRERFVAAQARDAAEVDHRASVGPKPAQRESRNADEASTLCQESLVTQAHLCSNSIN